MGSTMGGTEDVRLLLHEYYDKEVVERDVNGKVDSVLRVYVTQRPKLVEWTVDTCEHCRLSLATANLAVLLMDRVLSRVRVPSISLQLVAGCCVILAAKFEEPEQAVPRIDAVRACCGNVFSVSLFKKMEVAILTELKWRLSVPTASHFLDAFLARTDGGILDSDTFDGPESAARLGGSMDCATRCLAQQVVLMHNISILDFDFTTQYTPSIMAAAILMCSRWAMGIRDQWPEDLEALTRYTYERVRPCGQHLCELYNSYLSDSGRILSSPTSPDSTLNAAASSPSSSSSSSSASPSTSPHHHLDHHRHHCQQPHATVSESVRESTSTSTSTDCALADVTNTEHDETKTSRLQTTEKDRNKERKEWDIRTRMTRITVVPSHGTLRSGDPA